MSRAFMKEVDNLGFCKKKNVECLYADADGVCKVTECKKAEPERPNRVSHIRIVRPGEKR